MYIGEIVVLCIYSFPTHKNSYVLLLQKVTEKSKEEPAPLEIQY